MVCEYCGGQMWVLLGQLGNRVHLRCRDCGMDISCDAGELNDDDDE